MNLVITDSVNKKFHPYIEANAEIENFIMGNINAINAKNNTFLTVQMGINVQLLKDQGYTMDQGMFEKLVFEYNANLTSGQKRLDLWLKK